MNIVAWITVALLAIMLVAITFCAWSSAMNDWKSACLPQAKDSHWAKGTYDMVAEVIRKVARYDDGKVEGAASENERVRLIIATAFADRFEADNPKFNRSRFLKACNDG